MPVVSSRSGGRSPHGGLGRRGFGDESHRAAARDHARVALRRSPRPLRTAGAVPRPQVTQVLDEAVRHRRVIVLTYRDSEGVLTRRAVEPAAIAATNGHWYLLGYCRLRQAPRWFRLDRIGAADLTAETG